MCRKQSVGQISDHPLTVGGIPTFQMNTMFGLGQTPERTDPKGNWTVREGHAGRGGHKKSQGRAYALIEIRHCARSLTN